MDQRPTTKIRGQATHGSDNNFLVVCPSLVPTIHRYQGCMIPKMLISLFKNFINALFIKTSGLLMADTQSYLSIWEEGWKWNYPALGKVKNKHRRCFFCRIRLQIIQCTIHFTTTHTSLIIFIGNSIWGSLEENIGDIKITVIIGERKKIPGNILYTKFLQATVVLQF